MYEVVLLLLVPISAGSFVIVFLVTNVLIVLTIHSEIKNHYFVYTMGVIF